MPHGSLGGTGSGGGVTPVAFEGSEASRRPAITAVASAGSVDQRSAGSAEEACSACRREASTRSS